MLNLNRIIVHNSKLDNTKIKVLRVDSNSVVIRLYQNGNDIVIKLNKDQVEDIRKSLSLYTTSGRCDISIDNKMRTIKDIAVKTIRLNRCDGCTFTSRGDATITMLETAAGIVVDITAPYKEHDDKNEWDMNIYLMTLFDHSGKDHNSLYEIFDNIALAMM